MSVLLTGSHGTWSLPEGATTVGRSKTCELYFADPRLSRKHVIMHVTGSHLVIEDLGSTNGALVNSDRISGKVDLKNGDVVVIGPCIFTVQIEPGAPTPSKLENIGPNPIPPVERERNETQAMDPTGIESRRQGKQISPAIAAIVGGKDLDDAVLKNETLMPSDFGNRGKSGLDVKSQAKPETGPAGRIPTESLKPDDYKVKTTSALHAGPKGDPNALRVAPYPHKIESESLSPNDAKSKNEQDALQIHTDAPVHFSGSMRKRRTMAAVLDSAQTALIALLLSVPLAVCSYGFALRQAQAILQDNLPRMPYGTAEPATFTQIVMSLTSAAGWQRAVSLCEQLHSHEDQKPFMLLFFGATLSILVFVLTHLLATVAATVLKGAPMWHRSRGLVLVNRATGHYLGWGRAMLRWTLYVFLWPLGIISVFMDKPSLHDVFAGSEIRPRR
jgi:hypothetical protein